MQVREGGVSVGVIIFQWIVLCFLHLPLFILSVKVKVTIIKSGGKANVPFVIILGSVLGGMLLLAIVSSTLWTVSYVVWKGKASYKFMNTCPSYLLKGRLVCDLAVALLETMYFFRSTFEFV